MITRTLKGLVVLLILSLSTELFAGYRTFLDPRSMSMGGTGVASSTKFNASNHNPALIAFSKGDKPDKIYISASQGLRETDAGEFERTVENFQQSQIYSELDELTKSGAENEEELRQAFVDYRNVLRDINLVSYRKDETTAFSLLADTRPITVNFYLRSDVREMVVIRNQDEAYIGDIIDSIDDPNRSAGIIRLDDDARSSVDEVYFEIEEFGATVATTNVIEYNIPISWGFTPKLIEIHGSHIASTVDRYDLSSRPPPEVSRGLLEWNLDIGFAALLTDDFLRDELGLDGFWLEGEWVFGMVGMNMFPTDFTSYFPQRRSTVYPGEKRSVQALYQLGLAHYREDFMVALDIDLTESEVWDFEGTRRFISLGGEYYWRNDFHLRAGMRFNTAQTSEGGQDKALLTGGFMYQPHGFSIEAAAVFNGDERGGSLGFGLAF